MSRIRAPAILVIGGASNDTSGDRFDDDGTNQHEDFPFALVAPRNGVRSTCLFRRSRGARTDASVDGSPG